MLDNLIKHHRKWPTSLCPWFKNTHGQTVLFFWHHAKKQTLSLKMWSHDSVLISHLKSSVTKWQQEVQTLDKISTTKKQLSFNPAIRCKMVTGAIWFPFTFPKDDFVCTCIKIFHKIWFPLDLILHHSFFYIYCSRHQGAYNFLSWSRRLELFLTDQNSRKKC